MVHIRSGVLRVSLGDEIKPMSLNSGSPKLAVNTPTHLKNVAQFE
jgi:hypothetical protein